MQELQFEECRNSNAAAGTSVWNAGTAVEECRNSNAAAGTSVRNSGTAVEECRNSNAAAGTSVRGSAGRADRGDRERLLDWVQRPVRKRLGASYMRRARQQGVSGVAKRSPTAFLWRVQEIVMLTLIEETPFI